MRALAQPLPFVEATDQLRRRRGLLEALRRAAVPRDRAAIVALLAALVVEDPVAAGRKHAMRPAGRVR